MDVSQCYARSIIAKNQTHIILIRLRTNRRSHHDSISKNMENLGTGVERSLLLLVR